jgi:hypothetical protein
MTARKDWRKTAEREILRVQEQALKAMLLGNMEEHRRLEAEARKLIFAALKRVKEGE